MGGWPPMAVGGRWWSYSWIQPGRAGAYVREVRFYQDVVPALGAGVPTCHHAWLSDDGSDFVLLLEDLAPATIADQRDGCTADQAAAVLAVAADLHGRCWGNVDAPWLPVEHVWGALAGQIPALVGPWLERFGRFLDPDSVTVVEKLADAAPAWLSTLAGRRTVWHGDLRLDNVLFDARGGASEAVVVDWQSAASGPGTTDVSYFIGTSLECEDRAAQEHDLVSEYHGRLTSHAGVTGYDFDACWLDYRAHALYALVLTVPVSMGVQSTERGDAMFGAMAARAARQAHDLDAVAALDRIAR